MLKSFSITNSFGKLENIEVDRNQVVESVMSIQSKNNQGDMTVI